MIEQMRHEVGCVCRGCYDWVLAMAGFSGLCVRCHRPFDDHNWFGARRVCR